MSKFLKALYMILFLSSLLAITGASCADDEEECQSCNTDSDCAEGSSCRAYDDGKYYCTEEGQTTCNKYY